MLFKTINCKLNTTALAPVVAAPRNKKQVFLWAHEGDFRSPKCNLTKTLFFVRSTADNGMKLPKNTFLIYLLKYIFLRE
jgi:hypothetical protein